MRAVVQRVTKAEVRVDGTRVGAIGPGLLLLVAVGKNDTTASGDALAEKVANLRIFDDDEGRMNHSLLDTRREALCVSQFTLYGDCRKGRRPSYDQAAPAETAQAPFDGFTQALRGLGIRTATGRFRARMEVELVNDGPVTLLVDTDRVF
jgi:D-tyrosyl-tRNA(Tyr) deacylase